MDGLRGIWIYHRRTLAFARFDFGNFSYIRRFDSIERAAVDMGLAPLMVHDRFVELMNDKMKESFVHVFNLGDVGPFVWFTISEVCCCGYVDL